MRHFVKLKYSLPDNHLIVPFRKIYPSYQQIITFCLRHQDEELQMLSTSILAMQWHGFFCAKQVIFKCAESKTDDFKRVVYYRSHDSQNARRTGEEENAHGK